MARLGQGTNDKNTENGKALIGQKDIDYIKQVSREAVEEHHNQPVKYFELDWEGSKKNFYGEILVKRFINPTGVDLRGQVQLQQGDMATTHGVPYKTMTMTFSVYTEQLQEKGVEPKLNDYFLVGTRYYQIWDKTINDVGPGQIMLNRGRMRCDYKCYEVDDEAIQHMLPDQNPGAEWNINHSSGQIINP